LFPISIYAEKIAEAVINMYEHENDQSVELFFNDRDIIAKERVAPVVEVEVESDPAEIDELLEGDISGSDLDDDSEIKNITRPIKVDDEEPNNIEDE
jgi:predicted transcriptional regulator